MRRSTILHLATALLAIGGLAACGGGEPAADDAAAAAGVDGGVATGEGVGADRPVVTAVGVGRASGPPDVLVVSLNVHTEGASAAEAMDTTSLVVTQLQATVREQGVAEEDLQTTSVSVFPRFDPQGRRVIGFGADNAFTVRYRDLATAGGLVDQLVGQGGDSLQVQGVALEIDDPTELLAEARADAVARAAAQAEQLAAAAGVELGAVRTIVEVPVGSTGFDDALARATGGSFAADQSVAVPIASGGQEVSVQVQVVYDLGAADGG